MLALVACESATEPPPQMGIAVVTGADQSASAMTTLAQPVSVRVMTADQRPAAGAKVSWFVIEGGGSVDQAVTVSDASGIATVHWTLGRDIGSQLLLARSGNASTTIRATARFEVVSVSAGYRHSCAVAATGEAYCWGYGAQGQLGNGAALSSSTPVRVQSPVSFTRIAAGWSDTCALDGTGAAYCWGDNSVGQLGVNSTLSGFTTPQHVRYTDAFVDISTGFVHTCGVTDAGDRICWGMNGRGQLGGTDVGGSVRVSGQHFVRISAGEFHTCGVRADNVVMCWGWNTNGALGTNAAPDAVVPTATAVADSAHYSIVSAASRHTCALGADGRVRCWGLNGSGEIGYTPFYSPFAPALVAGTQNFTAVGIGNAHACGISNQRVYCWGGQPFNGQSFDTKDPTPINLQLQFSAISVGYEHTCGIAAGEVWCWGSNAYGQLGQANLQSSMVPVRVPLPAH